MFHVTRNSGSYGEGVDEASASSTSSNFELAFVPTAVIVDKQTMIINASITAYSTAVGPSSDAKNRLIFLLKAFMGSSSRLGKNSLESCCR